MTSPVAPPKLFVFGLGFSSTRAAMAFHARGFAVAGTCRSPDAMQSLIDKAPRIFHASTATSQRNVFIYQGDAWNNDMNDGVSLHDALVGTTHMIVSIPPNPQGDVVLQTLPELVELLRPTLHWLGYLSTIGVYGETNGQVVTEAASVGSSVPRNQARILAERQWLESGLPCHIFRLAGIYGPGRGPLVKVREHSAKRVDLQGRVFNRIHVDDIVKILVASAKKPRAGGIYNGGDDEPAPAEEVVAYAAELVEHEVPPLVPWEQAEKTMSAMAKSFYEESKVIGNAAIKNELGVVLRYPTYREGLLAQVLEEETGDAEFLGLREASTVFILVNNGSLRPEPFLELRRIAFRLSRRVRSVVIPCSFRFSDRIDPALLNNLPAKTLEKVMAELGRREIPVENIVVLPLILGNSASVRDITLRAVDAVWNRENATRPSVHIGRSLVDLTKPEDDRVAQILAENVRIAMANVESTSTNVSVFVVEHGSPNPVVHAATDAVTDHLRLLLASDSVAIVANTCMERREGPDYDFNGPLLRDDVNFYEVKSGVVIFALLFLSCGRHAGPGGDIDGITEEVRKSHPDLDIRLTNPFGAHAKLTDILEDRLKEAVQDESIL